MAVVACSNSTQVAYQGATYELSCGGTVAGGHCNTCGTPGRGEDELMNETLDLDALPLRERDKMVSQVMHFLIDRGYHIYAPTLDGYARVGEQSKPDIARSDLRIEPFRTNSQSPHEDAAGVVLTHIPTGCTVRSGSEHSQLGQHS